MRLIAAPGIGLAPLRGRLDFPGHSLTLIAKVKLALSPSGTARVLNHEPSFPSGDEPYADDALGAGAPRYASDFVHHKPCAEVLAVGHFHAPERKPVRAGHVALGIAGRSTRLCVIGRRRYAGGPFLPGANEAEPFQVLPLRWEHAYGGPGHAQNPLGMGYASAAHAARDFRRQPLELPRIERSDRLLTRLDQALDPVCFAPRPCSWPVRQAQFGSCDARWLETRWPWFPEDLDPRYFLSAPPALQQPGYLRGDETLCLENMHAQIARYETRLPGLCAVGMVQRASAQGVLAREVVVFALDTLWIDMDHEVAQLVWRGSLPCRDAAASDIQHAFVELVPRTLALTPDQICARGARAVADDEACWLDTVDARAALPLPLERTASVTALWTRERVEAERDRPGALRGADLSELDLSGVELANVDLRDVRLARTRLDGADLSGALLAGATLSETQVSDCRFDEACFDGAQLARVALTACSARGVRFVGARLESVAFSSCKLEEADFEHAQLGAVTFSQCTLDDACLEAVRAPDLVLEASSVARLRAARAELQGARWSALIGADISCEAAFLRGARLLRCELPRADFSAADLGEAELRGCALIGAKFAQAQLSDAQLLGCDCFEATFEEAHLSPLGGSGSSFFRAEFLGAQTAQFRGARRDLSGSKLAQSERGDRS